MARTMVASGTNSLGPDLSFIVDENAAGELRVIMKEAADTVTLTFDHRGQALEWIRDLHLAINAVGHR